MAADQGTDLFRQGLTPLPRPLGGRLSTQPFRKTIHCPVPRSLGNGVTVFTADGLSAPSSEGQEKEGPPPHAQACGCPTVRAPPPPPSPSLQPPPSPLLLLLPPARVPVCTDANSGCASRTDLGSGRRPCQQGLTTLLSPAGVQPRLPVTQEGRVVHPDLKVQAIPPCFRKPSSGPYRLSHWKKAAIQRRSPRGVGGRRDGDVTEEVMLKRGAEGLVASFAVDFILGQETVAERNIKMKIKWNKVPKME